MTPLFAVSSVGKAADGFDRATDRGVVGVRHQVTCVQYGPHSVVMSPIHLFLCMRVE